MFKRKLAYEVVPESDYTDFSDREKKEKSSTSNTAIITAATAATASLVTYTVTKIRNTHTTIPTPAATEITPTIEEPINVMAQIPNSIPVTEMTPDIIQTGFIAESSLNMIANILDPVFELLVAFSFPIAGLVMLGGLFMIMIGQQEKAWSMIMNAGLGYVLIQLSPLFLDILREVGSVI